MKRPAYLTIATTIAALAFGLLATEGRAGIYVNSVAGFLGTTTSPVNVNASIAPTANQILTATDATHATWQTPAAPGASTLQQSYTAGGAGGGAITETASGGPIIVTGYSTNATQLPQCYKAKVANTLGAVRWGSGFQLANGSTAGAGTLGGPEDQPLIIYANDAENAGSWSQINIASGYYNAGAGIGTLSPLVYLVPGSIALTDQGLSWGSIIGSSDPSQADSYDLGMTDSSQGGFPDWGFVLAANASGGAAKDISFCNNHNSGNFTRRWCFHGNGDTETNATGSELATGFTAGGLYIPTTNGAATGTSTTRTGEAVFSYDRAGHALDVSVGATHVSMAGIVAFGRQTGQTAADGTVATYTVGSSDGSFIVSPNVNVTAATSATFSVGCAYYDETNTAQAVTFTFSSTGGTLLTSIVSLGAYEGVPVHIRAKAGTPILISTGGTFTSVTYNVEGVITQIQ